jgi:hypothetical protein
MPKKYKLNDGSDFEVPDEVYEKISSGASYYLTKEVENSVKEFFGQEYDTSQGTITSHIKKMVQAAKKISDTAIEADQKFKQTSLELDAIKQKGGGKSDEVEKIKQQFETQYKTQFETELQKERSAMTRDFKQKSFTNEVKAKAIAMGLKEYFLNDGLFEYMLSSTYDINADETGNVFVKNKQGQYVQDETGKITANAVADNFYKTHAAELFKQTKMTPTGSNGSGFTPTGASGKKPSEMSLAEIEAAVIAEIGNK